MASHNHWGISWDTGSIKDNRSAVCEGTQELFAKALGIFLKSHSLEEPEKLGSGQKTIIQSATDMLDRDAVKARKSLALMWDISCENTLKTLGEISLAEQLLCRHCF